MIAKRNLVGALLVAAAGAAANGCSLVIGLEDVVPTGPGGGPGSASSSSGVGGTGGAGGRDDCNDMEKDDAETDVDCGGGQCSPCPDGRHCHDGSDCENGVCTMTICQAPNCADGVANGQETDVDCGGSTGCDRCHYGQLCAKTSDCVPTAKCDRGVCAPSPIAQWVQTTPQPAPAVYRASVAFVPWSGHTLLFGGFDQSAFFSGTRKYDAGGWADLTPADSPAARQWSPAAYDAARDRVVLFGGDANPATLADTWEWDAASGDWKERTPAHAPEMRLAHAVAYDSARHVTVLFGGIRPGKFYGDTWEWDGSDWTQIMPTGSAPEARQRHAMAYDAARHVVVLFGGSNQAAEDLGDTWTWDGATWNQVDLGAPGLRDEPTLAYDSIRERIVLVGGVHTGVPREDTWEWDGAAWAQIASQGPGPDWAGELAFDASRARCVFVRGTGPYDTWEYFTLATPCFADGECGSGACADHLCCDSACGGSCRRCNDDATPGTCTVVTNAKDPDSCPGAMHCDGSGQCVAD